MTPTNIIPQDNFILFDYAYENVVAEQTDQYIYMNASAEIKDMAMNLDSIVCIYPAFTEIKDAIITDQDLLDAIAIVERR
jgi:hypothetical protein